eukprot:TRINITY_DN983_c0_g1_i12.p2 TRINITY_DN983_c0_g1~~TRINITY_DN983_c0_g1_i12.p2  ORF type:complete len:154 (-),score=39.42 TRINITY_DN983_c0_g1_i12:55-516(-)
MQRGLVGSEMCIRDRYQRRVHGGTKVMLTQERFKCPEFLFNPLSGKHEEGLHQFVMSSIMKCDEELRNSLLSNIVLAGGSMMFPGMKERMQKELSALAPEGAKVEVKCTKNCRFSAWIGGSIMSSLSTFKHMWLSKEEYAESGASVVAKKFPV